MKTDKQIYTLLSAAPEIQRLAAVRECVLREHYWELAGAREEGREEGIAQGEATILERQLRRRFGPVSEATRTRLRTATPLATRNLGRAPARCAR